MIGIQYETLLKLSAVPAWLQSRGIEAPTPFTVRRWAIIGRKNGGKLESIRVGNRIYTSQEALQRFFDEPNNDGPYRVVSTSAETNVPKRVDARTAYYAQKAKEMLG